MNKHALFSEKQDHFALCILLVVSFALFWQTTGFGFVWDDLEVHLGKNPFFNPPTLDHLLHFWQMPYEKLYIPVAYNIWGVLTMVWDNSPFVYHLANLVLHTANGMMVFILLRIFLKNQQAAFWGALLFIVHPVQVESVAWVSEFRGLLAAFFCFCALYFYLEASGPGTGSGRPSSLHEKRFYIFLGAGWLFFTAALLSKPSAAVMPLFAIAMEYYLYRPGFFEIFKKIWIFFIPVTVIAVMTASIQSGGVSYPFWAKPLIWMDALSFYLYKVFVPVSLAASYARTPGYVLGHWWGYVTWVLPVILGVLLWLQRKKNPLLVLSALLFVIGFLPVSGLIEFTFQNWSTVADRYLYLSMFGVALGTGAVLCFFPQKRVRFFLFAVIVVFAGISAGFQAGTWKNSLTLWNHCMKITPFEARAYTNRGRAFLKKDQYDRALEDFNNAIAMNGRDQVAYNNRGKVFSMTNLPEKALSDFSRAIRLDPEYADAYYNRGLLYDHMNQDDKSLADYHQAISLSAFNAVYYNNRGIVYGKKDQYTRAIADFNKAVSLDPSYADAYNNRGVTFFFMKEYAKALSDLKKSQSLGKKIDMDLLAEIERKTVKQGSP